jgi:hypothetical protein
MKSIEETLEVIKVNLAENQKPRQTIPTSRMNVWCTRCGDPGHYASKCQRPTPKRIHYVNPEEEVFYAQLEEEEEETSARRHLPSTTYVRTRNGAPASDSIECDDKPELSSGTKSGNEFQQSGKILQLR